MMNQDSYLDNTEANQKREKKPVLNEVNGHAAHTLPVNNSGNHNVVNNGNNQEIAISDVDLQEEINQLEEIIFDSFHIPLTGYSIVNEERLVKKIDHLRKTIPEQFQLAIDILEGKQMIISDAENQAMNIIESAKRRASQILDELGIIQQAEMEARELRQKVSQDCEALQLKTLNEVEQIRTNAQNELEHIRQINIQESERIQKWADDYADAVLNRVEQTLRNALVDVESIRIPLENPPKKSHK